ncbi:MAG: phosphomannomutase/phosphoglucomutase [Burkholderiaceae bacterium]
MTQYAPVHATDLPASIFKAYDIRGVVGQTLTEPVVYAIGQALGLLIRQKGLQRCVVGRDGRLSGPALEQALCHGLLSAGVSVIRIGQVPTPVVYFATHLLETGTGVAITGSHNPPDYNGLKMMVAGTTLSGEAIQGLYRSIALGEALEAAQAVQSAQAGQAVEASGPPPPTDQTRDCRADYLNRILSDVKLARPLKVAVDAGNGVAGELGPELIRRLGCEVTELFCEIDGHFPNHHPDPADPHNLEDLIRTVAEKDLDLGLAFDGDGDRLGVVTRKGEIIWPDRQLMLYAQDVLQARPGSEIIFDVKCSRLLSRFIAQHGGRPTMWKTGHSLIKAKLKETGAALAGEMSGHCFFNDRWYGFDDGLYTAARLLEILSARPEHPTEVLESLPNSSSTPELQVRTAEGENHKTVEQLARQGVFDSAIDKIFIDGIRVEYSDGFGLARASNTTPVVVLRFEADTREALARIQAEFRQAFARVMPGASLPF